jgi:hypothetical protein
MAVGAVADPTSFQVVGQQLSVRSTGSPLSIDLGGLATFGAMQQVHHPLAGVNLVQP